jgi:hypothetical protein
VITAKELGKVVETSLSIGAFCICSALLLRTGKLFHGLFLCQARRIRVLLPHALLVNCLDPLVVGLEIPHCHVVLNLFKRAGLVLEITAMFTCLLQVAKPLLVMMLALLQVAKLGSGTIEGSVACAHYDADKNH